MDVIIDLKNCDNEGKVLLKIGEILYLGGIDPNVGAKTDIKMKGWGINWDALKDSLSYLDTGGIWGNSPKFQFPLKLIFTNCGVFKKIEPDNYKILKEILSTTKKLYLKDKKIFSYRFK